MKKNYISLRPGKIHLLLAMSVFLTGFLLSSISYGQDTNDPFVLGINSGGDADYTAVDGTVYVADDYFTGGTGRSFDNDVSNTDDEPLYQTYRNTAYGAGSSFNYDIPLANGTYNVTLKFASYHQWENNEGDVIIEGDQVLTRFNPKDEVGWRVAIDKTFVVEVEDGELNIEFVTYDQPFYVNAILIEEYVPFNLGINSGGDDYTAADGTVYIADDYYTAGGTWSTGDDIEGTDDGELYKSERSNFAYSIPVANGRYEVTLKLAEIWDGASVGTRVGNYFIQGEEVLSNFDILEHVDHNTALDRTFLVEVTTGEIALSVESLSNSAKISAIFIEEYIQPTIAINAGSDADYTAVDGTVYVADDYFTGGSARSFDNDVSNTDDELLYQTYRRTAYGEGSSFKYDIPVANGTYSITLKFASYHQWETNEGDVIIEGNKMLTRFNPKDEVGWRVAIDTTLTAIVEDGELNIEFVTYDQPFYVNAILIEEIAEEYFSLVGNVENGTITMEPGGGSYPSGTEVAVTVEPDYGYFLEEWTGDLEGVDDITATTITVLMDKDKSITAVLDQHTMFSFEKNAENGKITVEPELRDSYISGTELTLTAVPDYGYSFIEWTGDLEGVDDHTATTITVLMDQNRSITAVFEENPMFKLTTNVENGNIYLNPQPDADGGMYYEGATVRLTAQPHVGYVFSGWSGDLSGDQNPVTIVMDKDMDITAEMLLNVFSLTIEATNGTVNTLPITGDEFEAGTQLVLQAIPDEGYRFAGWDGDLSGSQNPTSITINSHMHIIALFELTVVDIIAGSPDHTLLADALAAAGLVETLQGEGPFTVFAPTDDAINALPAGLLEGLSVEELTNILLYHVVGALAMSTDLTDGQVITTLLGQDVVVTISADGVFINDAQVTLADLEADNGVVHVIDAVLLPQQEPTVAAPTPTIDAANVISLFSDAYTDVPVDTWRTDWSVAAYEEVLIDGNPTKKYTNLDYVGIETVVNQIDITGMTHFHLDVWSPNATMFRVKLVDFGADAAFGGGDDTEHEVPFPELTQGEWVSLDIPLADFTDLAGRQNIAQLILSGLPTGELTVYVDNVFFYTTGTNVNELDAAQNQVRVYPNPARDNFNITAESVIRSIVVADITGKVVYNDIINDTQTRIHNAFESGIYIVHIYTDEGVFVRKLQIQK